MPQFAYRGTLSAQPEITQRDLRNRSKEITDAVENGQGFVVTRDGHRIAELLPLRGRQRFVSRQDFAVMSRSAPDIDIAAFRADQDAAHDQELGDPMAGEGYPSGLLDTDVVIMRRRIDAAELPDEMAISAVTLAELSAGPHQVRAGTGYEESAERARRLDVLQRAEHEFDAIPFDADAARAYGRVVAAVVAAGRQPRRRTADLMIAAISCVHDLPLFTTNPDYFVGLDELVTVVPVALPVR